MNKKKTNPSRPLLAIQINEAFDETRIESLKIMTFCQVAC